MDPNEQPEEIAPEVAAEIMQRHETPDERSSVSLNELRRRVVMSTLQPK